MNLTVTIREKKEQDGKDGMAEKRRQCTELEMEKNEWKTDQSL